MTEPELIARLEALSVDWPEPVDVTAGVTAQLHSTRRGWLPTVSAQRGISFAALAAIAAVAAALLLVPGARTAVARLLGFPGISVEQTSEPAPELTAPRSTQTPGATPQGAAFPHGVPVTLDEAQARVDFRLRTLPLTGQRVTVDDEVGAVHIAYRYEGGRVALLTQLRGGADPAFSKQSPDVSPTEVDGQFALWVAGGGEHAVLRVGGNVVEGRPSQNALLWAADGVTYRLELAAELPEAVRLAESLQ